MARTRERRAVPSRQTVLVAVLAAATAVGGWSSVRTVASGHDPLALRLAGVTYTVTHAQQITGLTDQDLGGMAHGVQGLVDHDHALVRVSMTVSAGSTARSFDLSRLRLHPRGTSVEVVPAGATLSSGHLAAHGRLEGSVSFVVPRDARALELRADGAADVVALTVDTTGSGDHDPTTGVPDPAGAPHHSSAGAPADDPSHDHPADGGAQPAGPAH